MNRLLEALVAKYNGQILEAKANIDVYRNSVGISEHSDIVAELDKQIAILTEAEGKLATVLNLLKEYE